MAPKKQTPLFGVGITTPHPGGVDPNLETIDFDALGGLAHLAATASGKPTKRCVLGCYPAQDPDSYSIAVPALRGDTVPEVAAYLHNDLHMDVDLPHAKQVRTVDGGWLRRDARGCLLLLLLPGAAAAARPCQLLRLPHHGPQTGTTGTPPRATRTMVHSGCMWVRGGSVHGDVGSAGTGRSAVCW